MLMDRSHLGNAPASWRVAEISPSTRAPADVLEGLTGFRLTRGVLCAMRRPQLPEVEGLLADARRVAVLEGIVDHTNVGAIFRSAAALDVDAVLVTPHLLRSAVSSRRSGLDGNGVPDSLDTHRARPGRLATGRYRGCTSSDSRRPRSRWTMTRYPLTTPGSTPKTVLPSCSAPRAMA